MISTKSSFLFFFFILLFGLTFLYIFSSKEDIKPIETNYGPSHSFEVVYTLENKKTNEIEKWNFITSMALSDNNKPIPVSQKDEYLNQVKLWLYEYIIHSKISHTSKAEDWKINVDQLIEINSDSKSLDELRLADHYQDTKGGLCWEDGYGKVYKDSEVKTQNPINWFSQTWGLLSDKILYYVPLECGTRIPNK